MNQARRSPITWRPVVTFPLAAMAVGTIGAIGAGAALIPFRTTLGTASVALILGGVIVLAAEFGGRWSGIVVGLVGSLTFNFFHTRPYYRFDIHDVEDVTAFILLALFGFLVGSWHRPHRELPSGGESNEG